MDQSQETVGEKIGRAARAFEQQRTNHGREWIPVFLNEDTIVIALHGAMTAGEQAQRCARAAPPEFASFTGGCSPASPIPCFKRSRTSPE